MERVEHRLDLTVQGLQDLGQFMRQIALDQAKHERFHLVHVDKLEADFRSLEKRVEKLEQRS